MVYFLEQIIPESATTVPPSEPALSLTVKQDEMIARMSKSLSAGGRKKPLPMPLGLDRITTTQARYVSDDARFAFTFLWLSGQRVGEMLKLKRQDLALVTLENGKQFLKVDSLNEKNPITLRRDILIPYYGADYPLADYCWKFIQGLPEGAPLLAVTRQTIWTWLRSVSVPVKALDTRTRQYIDIDLTIHPHYLRHCRASYLACEVELNPYQMMKFFGWKSFAMVDLYTSSNWKSLARAFVRSDAWTLPSEKEVLPNG